MHIAEVVTIAKSLPLLRLNTYKSLILSYSADYRRIFRKKIDVEVQWFNANSLRVLKMPHGQSVDKKSLSVIARPEKTVLKVSTSEDGNIVMKSRLLTVKLDTKTGVLIYETRNGMPLLKELENGKRLRDSILSPIFHSYIFAMYKNESLWI